jgi:CheY-like chemotaxis protein
MSVRFDFVSILIVDDNNHMRTLVAEILRAIGIKDVREAADGADALQFIRHSPPDIIITDFAMQPIDGVEFVTMVRKSSDSTCPMVPIIMMTGHSERHRVEEAHDAGVTEFLAKPISARSVLERILEVIERPRPFVRSSNYFGPCRRRKAESTFKGPWRRSTDDPEIKAAWEEEQQKKKTIG